MTIAMWIRVHPQKATHFENWKSVLHFIAFMVLHTDSDSHHTDNISHHINVHTLQKQKSERETSSAAEYLGTVIWIGLHRIMLETKKKCGRGGLSEMCVYLQRWQFFVFLLCRCPILPKISIGYHPVSCLYHVIGLCSLIKSF